jgi:hypothetical protein
MLNEILNEDTKNSLQCNTFKALNNYSSLYNQSKPKEKYKYLNPIRMSGMSRERAKRIGFKITSYMWKSCLNTNPRNKG